MALIICPECNKEISSKSELCVHCGFPIAKEKNVLIGKEEKLTDWRRRNQEASRLPDEQAIPLFLELGNEGYLFGYCNAGVRYADNGNRYKAYECFAKAYSINSKCCNGLVAAEFGYLHQDKESPFFDPEKAIQIYAGSTHSSCYRRLGQIYDPNHQNDGFERYKNPETALKYYYKLLNKEYEYVGSVYNDIGVIFGACYNNFVVAACYCLLAKRVKETPARVLNYETYIAEVRKKGNLWEPNILTICSHEDIKLMIDRVNKEIESTQPPTTTSPSSKDASKGNGFLILIIVLAILGFFTLFIGGENDGDRTCPMCGGTGYNGNGSKNVTEYVFKKTPCTWCDGTGEY